MVKPLFELETCSRGPFQDDPGSCGSPRRERELTARSKLVRVGSMSRILSCFRCWARQTRNPSQSRAPDKLQRPLRLFCSGYDGCSACLEITARDVRARTGQCRDEDGPKMHGYILCTVHNGTCTLTKRAHSGLETPYWKRVATSRPHHHIGVANSRTTAVNPAARPPSVPNSPSSCQGLSFGTLRSWSHLAVAMLRVLNGGAIALTASS